jgi:hypothetical protein
MRQYSRQTDYASSVINRRGLHRGDLMLAQGFAYDLESAGERRIAERPFDPTRAIAPDGGHQRLLGVGEFGLTAWTA